MRAHVADPLILGINPLAGMDHYLRDRARNPYRQRSRDYAVGLVKEAVRAGARGINLNAGPDSAGFLKDLLAAGLDRSIGLYPMIPDERFFGALLNQGTLGAVSAVLSGLSIGGKARAIFSGGWARLTNDPYKAFQAYIDIEIDRLDRVGGDLAPVRTVLVHELITDGMVALGATEAFARYVEDFRTRRGIPAGFVTRNFVRFCAFSREARQDPRSFIVLTPTNLLGFQMAPSREEVERELSRLDGSNVVGISLLGGGMIPFRDAAEYLRRLKGVYSVAVGVSNPEHANSTFSVLGEVLKQKMGSPYSGLQPP